MLDLRIESTVEDLSSVETVNELEAMLADEPESYSNHVEIEAAVQATRYRLALPPAELTPLQLLERQVAALQAQIAGMLGAAKPPVVQSPQPPVKRASRKYVLRSFDVKWSTKPQVHAIASILEANFKVDEVVAEDEIVSAMEANVAVLDTRQGGKKVWNYYKGDSADGLLAHGNIERA